MGLHKPCQILGSNRAYATKMRGKNADAEYRKVYKRLHQRKQKGAMTEQAFKECQGNAQYLFMCIFRLFIFLLIHPCVIL